MIYTSIQLPIKQITQLSQKSKLTKEKLNKKYSLQDFYIDASIQSITKNKIKSNYNLRNRKK